MAMRPPIDAREVRRFEALITATDTDRAAELLERCVPGSAWLATIRTAEVDATIVSRKPLGTFDEKVCTCVSLRLALPVPVEPGLRFDLTTTDGELLSACGIVRPWDG